MSLHEAEECEAAEAAGLLPHYLGDDPRPTSKRELAGWYCYGWAAEVFTVCAMGMCITNDSA
jgi:UMF1 family MFS transporter